MKQEKNKIKIIEKDIRKISRGDLILIGDDFHLVIDFGVSFFHNHYYIKTEYYKYYYYDSRKRVGSMKIYEHQIKKIKVVKLEDKK